MVLSGRHLKCVVLEQRMIQRRLLVHVHAVKIYTVLVLQVHQIKTRSHLQTWPASVSMSSQNKKSKKKRGREGYLERFDKGFVEHLELHLLHQVVFFREE